MNFLRVALFALMSLALASCTTTGEAPDGTPITGGPTVSFADAMTLFTQACSADVQRHCPKASLGGGELQQCLASNASSISSQCQTTYAQAFDSLQKRVAAQEAVPAACQSDARRLCSNFRQGEARILNCLIRDDIARQVSRSCNAAISQAGWR